MLEKNNKKFKLKADFKPAGDQPKAIKQLVEGFNKGYNKQVLLGVTGSGKTFTMSNVIAELNRPTLVMAHNKTLAAQLFAEFRELFPENRVEYFVSYYDYYQPESYIPSTDTYIEKDSSVNAKIEQMRLSATEAILSRRDVIVVASVSAIYSLGDPTTYETMGLRLRPGDNISRSDLIHRLIDEQYERNDTALATGKFRVKGDVIDVIPAYMNSILRIELFGEEIDRISFLDPHNLTVKEKLEYYYLFPARHFVIPEDERERAIKKIEEELNDIFPTISDPLLAYRLKQRTQYDMEMLRELGFCKGIENYSRHFDGRKPGEPPFCLLNYFPKDFLFIIDESHQTLPQVRGMYEGDFSRKRSLVDFGFRLPSAFDNRPLKFDEFSNFLNNVVFVSATPADRELKQSNQVVEQIIRPTGLIDPLIETHSIQGQMDHLIDEINTTVKNGYRCLVITLTKRMAEELTDYLGEKNIRVRYLHSEIDTLERTEILRQLRAGDFDVLVGINLLREGIDLPEVALVAILDADKEGFLRNERSLIQIVGRAARNVDAKVILYMDNETDSIKNAIRETSRRREIQVAYNKKHNITPKTIIKAIPEPQVEVKNIDMLPKKKIKPLIKELETQMRRAAEDLNFELAIQLRDRVMTLRSKLGQKGKG